MGVEPDQVGRENFHVTFWVVDHLTGTLVPVLMPLSDGPRHWGQFSAEGTATSPTAMAVALTNRFSIKTGAR
jgi:hypothetical protein